MVNECSVLYGARISNPRLREDCRRDGGKAVKSESVKNNTERPSSACDIVVILLKAQEMCLSAQDLHKIKLVKILTWMVERFS